MTIEALRIAVDDLDRRIELLSEQGYDEDDDEIVREIEATIARLRRVVVEAGPAADAESP